MSNLIYNILPDPARPILYIQPDINVTQCVEMMVHHNIGALVVMDDTNLLGIVSERDIIRGLLLFGAEVLNQKAMDILCADVAVLKPTDTVETAMSVILETKRRHVLVGEDGKIIAIISIGDVLFSLLNDKVRMIEELEHYIHH